MSGKDDSPIVFYQYSEVTDSEYLNNSVLKRFREGGHEREIIFKSWNCYKGLPERDGDLFSYDCVALSALCDKGFFHELPDIIEKKGIFEWMLDTARYKNKLYALPFITCFNAIICRKENGAGIDNIYDIKGSLVTPLKSMLGVFYLLALSNYQDKSGSDLSARALGVINTLAELMGGREEVKRSAFSSFDGIERFNSREADYFLGFTENLRLMPRGDYAVIPANFSDKKEISIPLFNTDVLSVGAQLTGEKLLDCYDLIEIMTAPEFQFDVCAPNGEPHYMLPANALAYPMLIEKDAIYEQLYRILSNDENCVFRFAKDYYEKLPLMKAALLQALVGD